MGQNIKLEKQRAEDKKKRDLRHRETRSRCRYIYDISELIKCCSKKRSDDVVNEVHVLFSMEVVLEKLISANDVF